MYIIQGFISHFLSYRNMGLASRALARISKLSARFESVSFPKWYEMVQNGLKLYEMVIFGHQYQKLLVKVTGMVDPIAINTLLARFIHRKIRRFSKLNFQNIRQPFSLQSSLAVA